MASCIIDLEAYVPPQVETNEQLYSVFSEDLVRRVADKTGIVSRHICPPDETAVDMAERAARALLERQDGSRAVQYVILCTQSPDHFLPSGACILQDRLGLGEQVGAFDFNLGCSGYVYGLDLANALIEAGRADCVLLLTGDTYSRYINPADHTSRLLFGEAASATLVGRANGDDGAALGPFIVRTDGSGAPNLVVPAGAMRMPRSPQTGVETADTGGAVRSDDDLSWTVARSSSSRSRR